MPHRVQRRRTRGWRMPAGTVFVGRPTRWGNPWRVGQELRTETPVTGSAPSLHRDVTITDELAVALYRIEMTPRAAEVREQLAGRDLACYCALDRPCHADVLLELANPASG